MREHARKLSATALRASFPMLAGTVANEEALIHCVEPEREPLLLTFALEMLSYPSLKNESASEIPRRRIVSLRDED